MKKIKILQFIIIGLVVISLGACSSVNLGLGGSSAKKDKTLAQGLGENNSFDESNIYARATTIAPHNQIYYYKFDNSAINQAYYNSINAQAEYLTSHPNAIIMLAGHTDERGSREYNIALGERRAKSVFSFLRLKGVGVEQIQVVSYGQEDPASIGSSDDTYALNRRVELIYEKIS